MQKISFSVLWRHVSFYSTALHSYHCWSTEEELALFVVWRSVTFLVLAFAAQYFSYSKKKKKIKCKRFQFLFWWPASAPHHFTARGHCKNYTFGGVFFRSVIFWSTAFHSCIKVQEPHIVSFCSICHFIISATTVWCSSSHLSVQLSVEYLLSSHLSCSGGLLVLVALYFVVYY